MNAASTPLQSPRLRALVDAFVDLGGSIERGAAAALLAGHPVDWDDVAPFVEESPHGYARKRIARTEAFEMLVMTWRPGQGSVPHDHAGSLCALKVVRGGVHETRYEQANDGWVDALPAAEVRAGEVVVDASGHVHALANQLEADEVLVTLHVYAPPLPELRRYAPRPAETEAAGPFRRARREGVPCVAIVGGGFSGTLAAAHVIRRATESGTAVHVVLHDRQAAFGEGAAYRTADSRHLLNVPAAGMSAWPDRPSHFLEWAQARDPSVSPTDFLPRRTFGEYVRSVFVDAATSASELVSAEIRRVDVTAARREGSRWTVEGADGSRLSATALILATGHRPPDDPVGHRWIGSRARYIEDPWASLALTAIAPDEPIVLLGTSLTAIDVLLTVTRSPRTAPVIALSRRGLLPHAHAARRAAPLDPSAWLDPLLATDGGPTACALVRSMREAMEAAEARGEDWRAVIDGMRAHTPRVWASLSRCEAERFLRHARSFWEVRRHRMPPSVAAIVEDLGQRGTFRSMAGRVLEARADLSGVSIDVRARGESDATTLRAAWVVNCTGPGSGARPAPVIASLVDARHLDACPLGLGVITGEGGRAVVGGRARSDLVVVGTLRKPELWESTAVPELREQARASAHAVMDHLASLERPHVVA